MGVLVLFKSLSVVELLVSEVSFALHLIGFVNKLMDLPDISVHVS